MNKNKNIKILIKSFFVLGLVAMSFQSLAVWQAPTGAPGTTNVAPPINAGSALQFKPGTLVVNGLQINTLLKLVDGTQGANKVLTSDANGNASWAAPATSSAVTGISIASTNGFTGTSSGGNTPTLTLNTSILSSLLKTNATGGLVPAVVGTDYYNPSSFNLTGPVTSVGLATSITDSAITASKIATGAVTATKINAVAGNGVLTNSNGTLTWAPASGGVTSVFGRTGVVVAVSGDYTVAQVTGAAPLASPVFTGNPTAPTPTAGDSDTSIATTAFVNSAISASGGGTVTGTGSQNYVTKWNSTGTGIVDSHIIDLAAGYVGIGTTTPQYLLEVGGMGFFGKSTGGAAGSIRFSDNDASAPNTITISTPAGSNLTTSYSLILPVDDGTANQILKTNGNGGLSWTDDQTGGVTSVFGRTGVVVAVSGDYTVAQVTGAAPLASPVFTGNPTAPTPTAGDSDTSIATTAFVNSAISASGNGAVWGSITGTLSAQADLQTALNAKQNLLTNSAGLLAALSDETGTGLSVFSASPAFTGNPTAPTPTAGDSDTSIATTAFVNSAISASGGGTVTGTGSQNYVTKWNSTGTGIVDSHIIDLAAGYVGIGTTTPQYLLEVGGMGFFGKSTGGAAGSIRFSDNDASAPNTITISTPAGSNLTTSYSLILPVDDGTANQILKTNGNGGLSWTDDQTGGVTSVFGRTGVVVAVSGDYTVAQVTGAAPLASPVFTGNPTAPTPTAGDSDTSIATTAFVNSAISASGGGDMYLANAQTVTGAKTFNSGKFILAGSGSGNTILNASATASGTLILPAATDTLVGKATTDVFTNKTYDTAGTGNIFKIAGTQISAISGNTNKVGTVSGTLTSGNCLKSDANGNIVDNGAVCGGGGGGDMILNAVQTVTGAKTFNSGKFILAGTSGTTILNASATASGTLILPAANDTLVGKATTDTLTNKTFSGNTNTLGGVTMNLSGDTTGDMYYRNSSGVLTRIAPGAQDTVLKMGASSVPAWGAAGGGGGTSISALTVASVPNTIDNANLTQTWQWNSLTGTGLALASSSNTTTGVNKIFEISRTGTTNSIYYSYGSYVTNTLANSGTGPNVGGYFSATGASSGKNYALTTNGGYVGIGVTAPTSRFQVGLSSTIGVGTVSVLAGSLNTVNGSGTDFLNTFVPGDQFTVGSTTKTISSITDADTLIVTVPYSVAVAAGTAYYPTAATRLTVLDNGRVGIGTTAPTGFLHIKAGTSVAGNAPLKFTSGTNLATPEAGAIEYNGTHLYFTDSSATRHQLDQQSAGGGGTPGGSNTQLQYNNNGAFGGTTGATTSGGVVTMTSPIIANIAPGANFTLTQNSVVPFTSVNTGAVANTLYLTTGKVGIGTNNPSKQLDITGSFNLPVTSASGTNGVIYQGGNRFIHSYHPTALFGNLFIGKDSGNFSLTSTAQDNIGLGVNTLDVLSSGTGNVAIGTSTLGLLQSGLTNVGVGHGVLAAVVSGDDNTAIGHNALSGFAAPTGGTAAVATVADKNTAVGSFSGVSNNTWVNTTAIGYNAVATASNMVRIGNTAVTVIQGQVAPTVGSDIRFKKDIVDSDLGLDFLLKLRPVSYKLKTEGLNEGTSYGFIAQEIESILDGKNTKMIYTENTKDAYKYVRYDDLIAPTVKAIQEQQKQIEALKAEIELLKKK